MMKGVLFKLYTWLPKKHKYSIGQSRLLQGIRNTLLKNSDGYKTITTIVNKNYLNHKVNFKFNAAIKVAARAHQQGIENTLLNNSLQLCENYFGNQNNLLVFDVGANFGYLSLVWANTIAANGLVYSFEPNKVVLESLLTSVQLNQLDKTIKPVQKAVGNENKMIELFVSNLSSNVVKHNRATDVSQIEMITLDQFMDKETINKCDLIKIDVDGIE